jgi:4-diphosphocytidyl-2-C-methyl-D-erythritol kinase
MPILLVNPRVAVPTGPVFGGWDGVDRGPLDPSAWRTARNDLAAPAISLAPVIAEVLAALANTSASLVRMSGSGATCFALHADAAERDLAACSLRGAHPEWWICPATIA